MSKLKDAESEAAETQVWIEFALKCGYIASDPLVSLSPCPIVTIGGITCKDPDEFREALKDAFGS